MNRKTVARRLIFFGRNSKEELQMETASSQVNEFEFDEMESFVHTKCKPVSMPLAVEAGTRRILGFEVAQMPAKGRLTKKSLKRYGKLKDERRTKRNKLFKELAPIVNDGAIIRSDSNPYYPSEIKRHFPNGHHVTVKGQRGANTGGGELKKIKFDPIFSLNHTCAMFRANLSRLVRKTWCTTKKIESLEHHMAIYAVYHNRNLRKAKEKLVS